MKLNKFISLLNWRQIIIHFVASCFFVYGFKTLATLYNLELLESFLYSIQGHKMEVLNSKKYESSDISNLFIFPYYFAIIGLFVAFLISLIISIKKKWFWFNSLIMLILTYLLYRIDLLGWSYFRNVFWVLGKLFNDNFLSVLVNGTLMLIVGLLFFFSKISTRFIEKTIIK
jgi:hypothetical protein